MSIRQPNTSGGNQNAVLEVFGEIEGDFVEDMPHNNIYRGFTEERTDADYAVSLDIDRLVVRHIDKALKYAEMLPTLKDVFKIFSDKGLQHALEVTNPGAYKGVILPWLTNSARQIINEQGNYVTDLIMNYLNRSVTFAYLVGNVKNVVQQLTGVSVGFHDVQGKHLKSALKTIKEQGYSTVYQQVIEKSREMYDRMENGFRLYTDLIKGKTEDFEGVSFLSPTGDFNPLALQHMVQSMVDTYLWIAKYNETFDRAINHTNEEDRTVLAIKTQDELEREAIDRANALVRRTQDSYGAEDKAPFQVGGSVHQAMIKFTSYLNSTNNNTFFRIKQANRDLSGSAKYKAILQALTLMYIVPSILDKMVEIALNKHFALDDDETLADVFLDGTFGGLADYILGSVPYLRQGVDLIYSQVSGKNPSYNAKLGSNPAVQVIEDSASAVGDLYKRWKGDKETPLTRKTTKQYMMLLALLTGRYSWVFGGASRPISYEVARRNEEIEVDTFLDGLFGYITGKPREEKKDDDN
jgi:hypothetical protein